MTTISNRRSRDRLKKIIHVLFPEYKHIRITKDLKSILSKEKYWLPRLFSKKNKVNYELMTLHYIPKKLTLLKYNNADFFSTVIEDVTSTEMRGESRISYYYTEIVKIKYPHIFKDFSIKDLIYLRNEDNFEDQEMEIVVRKTTQRVNKVIKKTYLEEIQGHPLYYEYMVIGAITAVVGLLFALKLI